MLQSFSFLMQLKPIIHISHVNINLDAFTLLGVNGNEYMFLAIVAEYQKLGGWASAGVGNNLRTKTGLKYHIGRKVKLSDSGTDKLYKRMVNEGYLEEDETAQNFRCSINYFVLTHSSKSVQQHEQERKQETASTTLLKFTYSETTYFNNFEDFKNEVLNSVKKLPSNVDFQHYFDQFRWFYTNENTKPYSLDGWRNKIKAWVEQDRNKGNLKVIDVLDKTDDELLADITRYGKMVSYPDAFMKYATYKEQVVTYTDLVEKAVKMNLLGDESGKRIVDYKDRLQQRVNTSGELVKFMKERQRETEKKQAETQGNETKTQGNNGKQIHDTEGVKIDLSKLAKQMKI